MSPIRREARASAHLWTIKYSAGSTSNVNTGAVIIPPTTTRANGFWVSDPIPVETAAGSKPMAAANEAMMTGRSRSCDPMTTASCRVEPCFRSALMDAIRTTPLRTDTPNREMKPTAAEMLKLVPVTSSLSNKEIADRLDLSEASVKASIQQLFRKTGVRTRSQLVRIALEQDAGNRQ